MNAQFDLKNILVRGCINIEAFSYLCGSKFKRKTMKKKIIALFFGLVGLAASAQQGQSAVGINIGVAPNLESNIPVTNFQIGAKYQYGVTDNIRLEADLDYGFKSNGFSVFDISANVQYLFNLSDKFVFYPVVGIGYGNINSASASESRFLFNVGVGAEYPITDNISIGAEIKFQYMKNFSRLPIAVGVTYKF